MLSGSPSGTSVGVIKCSVAFSLGPMSLTAAMFNSYVWPLSANFGNFQQMFWVQNKFCWCIQTLGWEFRRIPKNLGNPENVDPEFPKIPIPKSSIPKYGNPVPSRPLNPENFNPKSPEIPIPKFLPANTIPTVRDRIFNVRILRSTNPK